MLKQFTACVSYISIRETVCTNYLVHALHVGVCARFHCGQASEHANKNILRRQTSALHSVSNRMLEIY